MIYGLLFSVFVTVYLTELTIVRICDIVRVGKGPATAEVLALALSVTFLVYFALNT